MGFIANYKAKRAAKRAKAIYELELYEWERENKVLEEALDIFEGAAKGDEPDDRSLIQKKGELVLWNGTGIYHEAGRTASRYVGGSSGFSIPVVAGIRFRVGSFKGQVVPGEEMQLDKDQGLVKITNQRLIFTGPISTAEWSYAKLLSTFSNPERNDFIFGVSNRKKSSWRASLAEVSRWFPAIGTFDIDSATFSDTWIFLMRFFVGNLYPSLKM